MATLTSADNLRAKTIMPQRTSPEPVAVPSSPAQHSRSGRANSSTDHHPSSSTSSRSSTPTISEFDQSYADSHTLDIDELAALDSSSTVIDGKISFVLGCTRQPLRHVFKTSPAFANPKMASNYLTAKIDNFLRNTDHTIQEWQENTCAAKANIKRVLRGGGGGGSSTTTPERLPTKNEADDDDRTIADGDWEEVKQRETTHFPPTHYEYNVLIIPSPPFLHIPITPPSIYIYTHRCSC